MNALPNYSANISDIKDKVVEQAETVDKLNKEVKSALNQSTKTAKSVETMEKALEEIVNILDAQTAPGENNE